MNKAQFQAYWNQIAGKIQKQWGKLTDDDLQESNGNWRILSGKIQERYGTTKEEADKQIEQFRESLGEAGEKAGSLFNQASAAVNEFGEKIQTFSKDYQNFVKEKPMTTAAILLVTGALVGMLIAK
jgi:uncharacterized protein YjbJ (UPF0337 family)